MTDRRAVVFDIGNVLVHWDPRHLFRKLIPEPAAMETFLDTVCTQDWNQEQDRGRPWAEAIALLVARHPQHEALIRAFRERWQEMIPAAVEGAFELIAELRARDVPVYGLSNYSADTYEETRARFPGLDDLDGLVVSGYVGVIKPDAAIFRILIERYALDPAATLFADDMVENIEAARAVGWRGHVFTDTAGLRAELSEWGIL